jgi:uncharacterized protein YbaR (Trm112 family)
MAIDLAPELLDILACPNCHGSLAVDHDRDELVCLAADCGLAYPVRQGIPVLLIDEARRPGPDLPGSAASAASASPAGSSASSASPAGSTATAASAADVSAETNGSASGPATGASAADPERS